MKLTRQLFSDVFLLQGEVGGRLLQLTLLAGAHKALLLDTGCASHVVSLVLPAMKEIGISPERLSYIISTHCDFDHQGGNYGIKKVAPQALLACGTSDREAVESPEALYRLRYDAYRTEHGIFYDAPAKKWILDESGKNQLVDMTLRDGERIRLSDDWEIEILHLPGHSQGHLGILDRKNRALYGGDAIHGSVYLDLQGRASLCPTYLDISDYLETIRRVENLRIETYVGCHWPVKEGAEIVEFCTESRRFVEQAENEVLRALSESESGMTLRQLCEKTGPNLGEWPPAVNIELCYALAGHLQHLEGRGIVQKTSAGRPATYKKCQE
jgi:glyoxylase-like metal-dependent hydrolase (beta-lactamase superfamily II)